MREAGEDTERRLGAHFVTGHAGALMRRERLAAAGRVAPADKPDSLLDPDAVAQTYLAVLKQPRSAWTSEVAVSVVGLIEPKRPCSSSPMPAAK